VNIFQKKQQKMPQPPPAPPPPPHRHHRHIPYHHGAPKWPPVCPSRKGEGGVGRA
jgi:hypothetical protein